MEFILNNPLPSALGIGFILIILFLALKSSLSPYVPVKALMTDAELNFYRQLMRVVPKGILVFSKVRIADVVDVKPSLKGQGRIKHFKPIAAKHFDFVLVDDKKMQILGAIELNDSSHDKKDRKERDIFVRKVMSSAKLPLFEIKATRKYKLDTLQADMLALLTNKPLQPQTSTPPVTAPDSIEQAQAHIDEPSPPSQNLEQTKPNPVSLGVEIPVASPNYNVSLTHEDEFKPKPLASFMDQDDVNAMKTPLYDDPIELSQRLKNANQQ